MLLIFLILTLSVTKCCAISTEDNQKIEFIKSFIQNELNPTHLVFNLCWGKSADVLLTKEMSKTEVRSSKALQSSKYLDQGLLFLTDLDCPDVQQVIDKALSRYLFRMPYRWLVLTNSYEEVKDKMEELPILADSDLVLAEQTDDGFRMFELYKPAPQAPIQSTLRGYFNGSFTDVRPHRNLFRRRRDLHGYPLTMAAVVQDSNTTHQHLETRLEPQHDYQAKVTWLNVRLGFEMLNATPRHIWTYRWGYVVNGSWSGMVEELRLGKADVGSNCYLKSERMDVVAYTDNLAPFAVKFIFRQPPLSYVSNIFRLTFSPGVWVALFVCTLASCLGLWAATYWEARIQTSRTQLDGSFSDSLLLTMGALSQQGCTLEPNRASGRIMTLLMLMTLMALYTAYAANIVVLLQAPASSIRTLAHLGHSTLTLGANDVDYNHFILREHSHVDDIHRKIYKSIRNDGKSNSNFYSLAEGVQRIRKGLFAFHSVVEPVYRLIEDTFQENEKCDLVEVDYLGEFDGFVPVAKNSSYLELLRVVFKQIQESGIKQAIVKRQQTPKPKCDQKGAMFSSVGLTDLMPVIILMLYGAAVSFGIVVIEILVHRLIQHRKTQRALINNTDV